MDFSTRGSQQSPASPRPSSSFQTESSGKSGGKHGGNKDGDGKWVVLGKLALLVAVAVLLLAVLVMLIFPNTKNEKSYVDSDKLQAVFLTNDQVYFGKIDTLNNKYVVLSDIYYLRTQDANANTSASTNNNVSLVKLGCELHKPYDQMVINRSEVQFWENLQADGQVAQAVASYAKTNPNNTCSNTNSNATSGSSVQGGSANNTNTNSNSNTNSTTKTP
jgi:hypothetical protein